MGVVSRNMLLGSAEHHPLVVRLCGCGSGCGLIELLAGSTENAIRLVVVLCGRDMQHRLRLADILKWVWQGSGLIDCVISK